MPPSEQNPAPTNQPVSNVPEYLHLDPIPEPKPPKSKKKMFFLLTSVVVVILLATGAVAAWVYMSGEPERRLYSALENAMATNYVSQTTVIKTDSSEINKVETVYDLSDPAQPKSHSKFTTNTGTMSFFGEVLVPNNEYYYVKFSKLPSGDVSKGIIDNQWYKVSRSNIDKAPLLIRSINFDRINRAGFGDVVTGKLNDGTIATLVDYIKTNAVYGIDKATITEQQAVYELTLNSQRTAKMNKRFAELLNVKLPSLYDVMTKTKAVDAHYTLIVDAGTGRISQIVQTQTDEKTKKTVSTTVTYDYPDSFTVNTPQNAKEVADV